LASFQSTASVVGTQLVNALSAFNLRGETSVQYGHSGPLLDFWTAPFFVLGVAYAIARVRLRAASCSRRGFG
jgi:hypothetical protein